MIRKSPFILLAALALSCAPTLEQLEAPCPRTGDCPGTMACVDGVCRPPCESDASCATGQRCMPGANGTFCATSCTSNDQCRAGVCITGTGVCGQLATKCSDGSACPIGGACCNETCVDARNDANNCGGCGKSCGEGQACIESACVCESGLSACTGANGTLCADLQFDAEHCGACGTSCGEGGACQTGGCTCLAGLLPCNGGCADVASDRFNCGGCGLVCGTGQHCVQGACQCPPQNQCGSGCADLTTDPLNCGACGKSCYGNTCGLSKCEPNTVVTETTPIGQFAVDSQYVYWTVPSAGELRRRPLGGGDVQTIVSDQQGIDAVALNGNGYLYWGFRSGPMGGIRRTLTNGSQQIDLVTGLQYRPLRMFIYGNALFFGSDDADGERSIWETTVSGGGVNWKVGDVDTKRLAITSSYLYGATPTGYVFRADRFSPVEPQYVEQTTGVHGMTAANETVYWSTGVEIRSNTPGTTQTTVAFVGSTRMDDLHVDQNFFYWSEGGLRIIRQPR